MSKNYYEILGVDKNSTQEEIKKAYRKKAMEHHPDKGGDELKFKEVSEAYDVLSDTQKKSNYDNFGSSTGAGQSFNMNDIFSQFGDIFGNFGGGFGFGQQTRQRRGGDLRIRTSITLKEVIFGVDKKIKYKRNVKCSACIGIGGTNTTTCRTCNGLGQKVIIQQSPFGRIQQSVACSDCGGEGKKVVNPCKSCNGDGTTYQEESIDITIPPGALNGMQLNLPGYGNFIRDGQPGDLFIMIEEISDPKFKREGCDLNCDEWVTISEAVLGSKLNIDTPHGKLSVDVPAGCESGKVFEIRGKGIPNLSSNGTSNGQGNLKVKVNVKIPKISTPEQRDVFEKLKNYL